MCMNFTVELTLFLCFKRSRHRAIRILKQQGEMTIGLLTDIKQRQSCILLSIMVPHSEIVNFTVLLKTTKASNDTVIDER